mgnify:CR=1 FL=1
MSALGAQGDFARCGERLSLFFVDSRGGHRESIGGFRILRDAAQGAALRTRSLSRKAGESFIRLRG